MYCVKPSDRYFRKERNKKKTDPTVACSKLVSFFNAQKDNYDSKIALAHIQKSLLYIKQHSNFDIIHSNIDDFLVYEELLNIPTVHTLHTDVSSPQKIKIFSQFQSLNYITISNAQSKYAKNIGLNVVDMIYNAVDVENYHLIEEPNQEYLAFLGTFTPCKGAHIAIEVAKKLQIPLKMAGRYRAGDGYFENFIKPEIDNKNIEFVGELNDTENALWHSSYRF